MSTIRPLIPLLVTAGILIGGNGLQGTFIALRASQEGFSTSVIGFVGAGYSIGFAIGCIYVTRVLRAIGHIRTFSAMAAIASASAIAMLLVVDPIFWFAMRLVAGICFASLFATVESWLNAAVTNANRARTLSIYRLVDLGSVTAAQYLIPGIGIGGFELFAIVAMSLSLSLVPISLADRSSPTVPEAIRFDVKKLWNISPLATVGCIVVGLTNAAFRNLGPIYAHDIGLTVTAIASFMSAGIVGGVVLQYPLGLYSDRLDRRLIILIATFGSALAALYLAIFAGGDELKNLVGIFVFGAFAMPLYSLCSAHANDHAGEGEHALVSAGMLFFWSCGAIIGPLFASVLLQFFGPQALFLYTAVVLVAFMAYTALRMSARPAVPAGARRSRFRNLLRTSFFFNKLADKDRNGEP
ncbi:MULTISPECIES: MFS transporter [unclassified Shinella]|jgi:MFS family permease|uniref:MFS transporter n=1 Tax=unclassified Shinella TaxID=2643062 RepID=UPI0003C53A13|nr:MULTISPECIES: MFS transporter [unclassified Shinella]MCA0344433.1 MFS transporter [Pseudomonadota bacterium]EYR80802.1 major facilitator superfamily MFS_1 [Shinella sp. DD12]MCO5150343.1 MFS transporter [Shinella sp.]MDC7261290.1 MFS transporter [Shinella sp. HY16]MDC7268185.1 MFS transporter [Shinella sp. YZ44]